MLWLGFCGAARQLTASAHRTAEAQALWATAWLTDNLDLPVATRDELERDIALRRAFARRRYSPIAGGDGTLALFEYLLVCAPVSLSFFSFYLPTFLPHPVPFFCFLFLFSQAPANSAVRGRDAGRTGSRRASQDGPRPGLGRRVLRLVPTRRLPRPSRRVDASTRPGPVRQQAGLMCLSSSLLFAIIVMTCIQTPEIKPCRDVVQCKFVCTGSPSVQTMLRSALPPPQHSPFLCS